MRENSPWATALTPLRKMRAPMEVSLSRTVRTVDQFRPASVTTPTRQPVSVMTQSPTLMSWPVPLLMVSILAQLE